jgi:uncharacterized membrane protein YdfJ with MMPL/SSD domain
MDGDSAPRLANRLFEEKTVVTSPVIHENAQLAEMATRLQNVEERQGHFAEEAAKMAAQIETNNAKPAEAANEAVSADMNKKLEAMGKDAAALKADLVTQLTQKARLLTDVSLVQSARRKLQDGLDFSAEQKRVSEDVAGLPGTAESLKGLSGITGFDMLSDLRLRDDLRAMAPGFAALGKVEKADGFFAKLLLRLQGLVTIRPKEGMAQDGSEQGKSLASLESALLAHDWKTAISTAESLQSKAPPEFAAWLTHLKTRASAESSLAQLEDVLLASLRNVKDAEQPAEKPAEEATP